MGCESKPPEQRWAERWDDREIAEHPQIIERRDGRPAFVEIEELYLGQSKAEAKQALRSYCGDDLVRRGSGHSDDQAYFVGCRLEDDSPLRFVRVGFWPKLDDAVAVIEIKRESLIPSAMLDQFERLVDDGDIERQAIKDHLVAFDTSRHRLYADWDEGFDDPAHLVVGFVPKVDSLETSD